MTTWYRCTSQRHLLKSIDGRSDIGDSHKGFGRGHSSHRTRQRVDLHATKPGRPNGPDFGFEEGPWTSRPLRAGAATGPAVGPEWQLGHSGQHDAVAR